MEEGRRFSSRSLLKAFFRAEGKEKKRSDLNLDLRRRIPGSTSRRRKGGEPFLLVLWRTSFLAGGEEGFSLTSA